METLQLLLGLALLAGVGTILALLWQKSAAADVSPLVAAVEKSHERLERAVREEIARNREETAGGSRHAREEIASSLKNVSETLIGSVAEMARLQKTQLGVFSERLDKLTGTLDVKLSEVRTAVEARLLAIQQDNAKQLEQMRATVDEKLQGTLEKRLGESFKIVSERLEAVAKGLGEMQALASGVGDLKRMLANVKTRGTWGEVQLGAMLEQILNPEQYAANVAVKPGAGERVEFAIKLPGRGDDASDVVWLPIDAKFPIEDYQRLVDAEDKADAEGAESAGRQLENRIKSCAADICLKYIAPPHTTDFAILFLPTEGLFAEVIRRTGLPEYVQRECRVVIAGPTTLWSILNSLQMGFRTLTIQKHSSEVWKLLGAVKTEWGKYGIVLDKVQKKLQQASNEMDSVAVRTRAIDRALQNVAQLPSEQAGELLMIGGAVEEPDGD